MYTCHFVHISYFVYTFGFLHTHYPTYAHPLIHAHYFFILIDTFVHYHLCLFLFHPHASLYLHLLLMHTFGLMLTQCSLHPCLPLLVIMFLNPSQTHFLLRAQLLLSMHPLCLYLHLLFINAFTLLILSTCLLLLVLSIFCSLLILFCFPFTFISPYYFISYLAHLGAPITYSPIFPHVISSRPSYLALFLGFLFLSLSFFSPFQCSASPPSSPTLPHHLPLLHLLLLSPPSSTHLSILCLTFFPFIFLHPCFLSLSFYIFGTTYVWPFSVILWLFEDFCTL